MLSSKQNAHQAAHAHPAARLHGLDRLTVRLEDGVELGLRDQPLAHARLLDREHRPLHRLALEQAVDGPGGTAVEHLLELAQEEEAHVALRCGLYEIDIQSASLILSAYCTPFLPLHLLQEQDVPDQPRGLLRAVAGQEVDWVWRCVGVVLG